MKEYALIKTDHDSDCAVYNEPAIPKGNCNCGLIPRMVDFQYGYVVSQKPFMHEFEGQGIANAFQAGFNCKAFISDDIEYLLQEFKNEEKSLFDKFGIRYSQTKIGDNTAELMRHLIFKLEEHIRQADNEDYEF